MRYSVLDDPVIEAEFLDGRRESLGIRRLLTEAHAVRDLIAISPIAKYAVLRTLVAFLMDMYRLDDVYDRKALLAACQFDPAVLERYVSLCEKKGPCFDLFDPMRPFMQSAYDKDMDAGKEKPIAALFFDLPSGNNHVHFDHRFETEHSASPAEAFQGLCATYSFCMAAAQGYPSCVNNTPPLYMLVLGETLFQTLVLNMLSKEECGAMAWGLPCWREDRIVKPKDLYVNVSMMEGMTWLPRRASLVLDEDGLVRKMYFQQGRNFTGNDLWRDPHVPRRRNRDGRDSSVKPVQGRETWRDLGAVTWAEEGQYIPPITIRQLRNVLRNTSRLARIWYAGLFTSNAAVLGWTEGELQVPLRLMTENALAMQFQFDMDMIEQQQNDIHYVTGKLLSDELASQAQMLYLQHMRDYMLSEHMMKLLESGIQGSGKGLLEAMWKGLVLVLRQVVDRSGSSLEALKKQKRVAKELMAKLNKQTKERERCEVG